jgi:hypothetical protein
MTLGVAHALMVDEAGTAKSCAAEVVAKLGLPQTT